MMGTPVAKRARPTNSMPALAPVAASSPSSVLSAASTPVDTMAMNGVKMNINIKMNPSTLDISHPIALDTAALLEKQAIASAAATARRQSENAKRPPLKLDPAEHTAALQAVDCAARAVAAEKHKLAARRKQQALVAQKQQQAAMAAQQAALAAQKQKQQAVAIAQQQAIHRQQAAAAQQKRAPLQNVVVNNANRPAMRSKMAAAAAVEQLKTIAYQKTIADAALHQRKFHAQPNAAVDPNLSITAAAEWYEQRKAASAKLAKQRAVAAGAHDPTLPTAGSLDPASIPSVASTPPRASPASTAALGVQMGGVQKTKNVPMTTSAINVRMNRQLPKNPNGNTNGVKMTVIRVSDLDQFIGAFHLPMDDYPRNVKWYNSTHDPIWNKANANLQSYLKTGTIEPIKDILSDRYRNRHTPNKRATNTTKARGSVPPAAAAQVHNNKAPARPASAPPAKVPMVAVNNNAAATGKKGHIICNNAATPPAAAATPVPKAPMNNATAPPLAVSNATIPAPTQFNKGSATTTPVTMTSSGTTTTPVAMVNNVTAANALQK